MQGDAACSQAMKPRDGCPLATNCRSWQDFDDRAHEQLGVPGGLEASRRRQLHEHGMTAPAVHPIRQHVDLLDAGLRPNEVADRIARRSAGRNTAQKLLSTTPVDSCWVEPSGPAIV